MTKNNKNSESEWIWQMSQSSRSVDN